MPSGHGLRNASLAYDGWCDRLPIRGEQRDEAVLVESGRVSQANFGVYGARKVWLQLNCEDILVVRCTVGSGSCVPLGWMPPMWTKNAAG